MPTPDDSQPTPDSTQFAARSDSGTSPAAEAPQVDTSRTLPLPPSETDPDATKPGSVPPTTPTHRHIAHEVGTFVGKYQIVQKLGAGGQAVVYRAVHPHIPGRDVVIKLAHADISAAEQSQLMEEGRILAGLELPGLVRVYDVDVDRGRPFVVFEFVRGRTLRELARSNRPDVRTAVGWTIDMADTLARVHAAGVVHRDLKPGNVLIDDAGRPRILDFGLGLSSNPWQAESADERGAVSGTAVYMAPEQARGDAAQIGPATDVFGLGGILYEMLTGRTPHAMPVAGETWTTMLARIVRCEILPPRQLNPAVPRALDAVVLRALAGQQSNRYRDMNELADALRRWTRRGMRWAAAAAAGLLLVIALASALLLLLKQRDKPVDEKQIAAATSGQAESPSAATVPEPAATSTSAVATTTSTGPAVIATTTATTPVATGPQLEDLRGTLSVRVWGGPGDTVRRGLSIDEPGALPVRNDDQVHIAATLNRAAYAFLLWIDTQGKVTALDKLDDPNVLLEAIGQRRELHSPVELDQGWQIVGPPGVETVILVACSKPMEPGIDFAKLVGDLGDTKLETLQSPEYFNEVKSVNIGARGSREVMLNASRFEVRGVGTRSVGRKLPLGDPVLQALERLRENFELVQAVRFAHAAQ